MYGTCTKGRVYLATVVTRTLLMELLEICVCTCIIILCVCVLREREREREREMLITVQVINIRIHLPLTALLADCAWSPRGLAMCHYH